MQEQPFRTENINKINNLSQYTCKMNFYAKKSKNVSDNPVFDNEQFPNVVCTQSQNVTSLLNRT